MNPADSSIDGLLILKSIYLVYICLCRTLDLQSRLIDVIGDHKNSIVFLLLFLFCYRLRLSHVHTIFRHRYSFIIHDVAAFPSLSLSLSSPSLSFSCNFSMHSVKSRFYIAATSLLSNVLRRCRADFKSNACVLPATSVCAGIFRWYILAVRLTALY